MRESEIEKKLKDGVKDVGGMAVKFISSSFNGMPDRLVLLPGGHLAFIELKSPNKKLRPLQKKRKRQLETLGFLVYCLNNTEQIGVIIDEIRAT